MSDVERWLAANDQYLADALAWLRQRLEQLAAPADDERPAGGKAIEVLAEPPQSTSSRTRGDAPGKPRSVLGRWFKGGAGQPSGAAPKEPAAELPGPEATASRERRAGAPRDNGAVTMPSSMIEAEAAEHPPALVLLSQRLGLSEFEAHTLLLCAAMELDTRIGALCAGAQHDAAKPFPTFALALALFDQPAWDVLSPERPLRYWRLIEINQPGAQPLVSSALRADERIVNYLKGLNYLDDRLTPFILPVAHDTVSLPPSQAQVAQALLAQLRRPSNGAPRVLQLLGTDSRSKLMIAQQAAGRLGLSLYRLAAEAVPAQTADYETFVRLWRREGALLPIALYVAAGDVDRGAGTHAALLQRLLSRDLGVVFFDSRDAWPDLGRDSRWFEIHKPTPQEQEAVWRAALGAAADGHPTRLAGQFNFNVATIHSVVTEAGALAPPDDPASAAPAADAAALGADLWAGALAHARPTLDELAQPLDPKATWPQLELPAADKTLLRQIAEQVKGRLQVYDAWGFRERMNRGLGISVLFAGDSGTGKTMAAEVMAKELQLLLYRIDLSAVVNKYIGETEKNLRRLFDAAEDGGAILFFDEADALFGKRSEVKDSHDRYANIEINYLLQRMESFSGLAILATNMKSALDQAFLRRLRFIVDFPFPGLAQRRGIWEQVFPAATPRQDLDYERLARFNLTGGSIHNIALNAAFLAARDNTPVTMHLVLEAVRNEYRKLAKPINEADFRHLESAGGGA